MSGLSFIQVQSELPPRRGIRLTYDMTMARKKDTSRIRFGTSSFSSEDWVGPFYPPGTKAADFLRIYAKHFDTVEVDSTYYRIPSNTIVDGWASKTPEDFLIAAKFPRSIVHAGEGAKPNSKFLLTSDHTYGERDKFLKVMSRLGKRAGPLVLQFPYFSKREFTTAEQFMDRLDVFLGDLPREFRYGVEIRNSRWLSPGFAELCHRHNSALVLVDQTWMPHGDEVMKILDLVTTDFVYIRLLGNRQEIEAITDKWDKEVIDHQERMQRWAKFLVDLLDREIFAYVYANNHYAGHAPMTARRLREMFLSEAKKA